MLLVVAKRLLTPSFINIAISFMKNLELTGLVLLWDKRLDIVSSKKVCSTNYIKLDFWYGVSDAKRKLKDNFSFILQFSLGQTLSLLDY